MRILLMLILLTNTVVAQNVITDLKSGRLYVIDRLKELPPQELNRLLEPDRATYQQTTIIKTDSSFYITKVDVVTKEVTTIDCKIAKELFYLAGTYYILDNKFYIEAEYIVGSEINWFVLHHKKGFSILYELQHNDY